MTIDFPSRFPTERSIIDFAYLEIKITKSALRNDELWTCFNNRNRVRIYPREYRARSSAEKGSIFRKATAVRHRPTECVARNPPGQYKTSASMRCNRNGKVEWFHKTRCNRLREANLGARNSINGLIASSSQNRSGTKATTQASG